MKRDETFDIVQGIAIILMVWGHIELPGTHFIYLFHMSVFFIISGYLFNEKNSSTFFSVIKYSWRKIKSLWIPFFFSNFIFLLLNNLLLKIGFFTENLNYLIDFEGSEYLHLGHNIGFKEFIKTCIHFLFFSRSGGSELTGATWFLGALFFSSLMFAFFDLIFQKLNIKKEIIHLIIGCIFVIIIYITNLIGINYKFISRLQVYFLPYLLITFGVFVKKYLTIKEFSLKINIIIFCLSLILLIICSPLASIEMSKAYFTNPFYFIVCSICGFFMLYTIALFCKNNKLIGSVLALFGKDSLFIMLLHFFIFKCVNVYIVLIYNMPDYWIAAYPTLIKKLPNKSLCEVLVVGGGYLFLGICIPVLMKECVKGLQTIKKD